MNWILASGSPRRRELLEMLGVPDLTIRPATGPERATPGAGPEQTVRELSLHKAQEVAQTCAPEDIIIAADTIVYLDGAILGKPKDHDDAVRMLTALSGREHEHDRNHDRADARAFLFQIRFPVQSSSTPSSFSSCPSLHSGRPITLK